MGFFFRSKKYSKVVPKWISEFERIGLLEANNSLKICSIAADGDVHNCSVPEKFSKEFCRNNSTIPAIWDQAHLLELAMIPISAIKWVKWTCLIVQKAAKKYRSCNEYDELSEAMALVGKC